MNNDTTQPREQAGIDLDKLIAKLEVIAQVVDGENLPNTANALRGIAADLTPQSAPEAQKAVAIVTGSSVQWLEGAGKLADRSPLYASPVAAPEAPTLPTNDEVFAEVNRLRDKVSNNRYVSTNAVNDTMQAVRSLLATPAATTASASGELLVTFSVTVRRDGQLDSDVQTHDNSYADVARGFVAIRAEIDRVFSEQKDCPHFPSSAEESRKPIVRSAAPRREQDRAPAPSRNAAAALRNLAAATESAWEEYCAGQKRPVEEAFIFEAGYRAALTQQSAAQAPVDGDAIAKSKRIMALIDTYVEKEMIGSGASMARLNIRTALMAEFENAAQASHAGADTERAQREAVEAKAKEIYATFCGAEDHPWVEGGNSDMQFEARLLARAAMSAATEQGEKP